MFILFNCFFFNKGLDSTGKYQYSYVLLEHFRWFLLFSQLSSSYLKPKSLLRKKGTSIFEPQGPRGVVDWIRSKLMQEKDRLAAESREESAASDELQISRSKEAPTLSQSDVRCTGTKWKLVGASHQAAAQEQIDRLQEELSSQGSSLEASGSMPKAKTQ